MLRLVIGDKQLSSWSLRPWILLRHLGIPFEEVSLPLDTARFREEIGRYSPARRVPVLLVAGREDPLGSGPAQEALAAAIEAGGGRAELHVLDGVGHQLHYERPGECAALLRAWAARGR
jgi:pimeloyl-ACP methyl ester carboxylesterase